MLWRDVKYSNAPPLQNRVSVVERYAVCRAWRFTWQGRISIRSGKGGRDLARCSTRPFKQSTELCQQMCKIFSILFCVTSGKTVHPGAFGEAVRPIQPPIRRDTWRSVYCVQPVGPWRWTTHHPVNRWRMRAAIPPSHTPYVHNVMLNCAQGLHFFNLL